MYIEGRFLIQLGVINILTIFALRNRIARHFITVQIKDSRSKVLHAALSVIVSLKCGVKQRLSYFYKYVVTCKCVRGVFVCLFICLFVYSVPITDHVVFYCASLVS